MEDPTQSPSAEDLDAKAAEVEAASATEAPAQEQQEPDTASEGKAEEPPAKQEEAPAPSITDPTGEFSKLAVGAQVAADPKPIDDLRAALANSEAKQAELEQRLWVTEQRVAELVRMLDEDFGIRKPQPQAPAPEPEPAA